MPPSRATEEPSATCPGGTSVRATATPSMLISLSVTGRIELLVSVIVNRMRRVGAGGLDVEALDVAVEVNVDRAGRAVGVDPELADAGPLSRSKRRLVRPRTVGSGKRSSTHLPAASTNGAVIQVVSSEPSTAAYGASSGRTAHPCRRTP